MKLSIIVLVIVLIAFTGINIGFDTANGEFMLRSGFVKGER